MKASVNILSEQNLWLKLVILVIAFTFGFDATIKQLLLQIIIFLLYFLLEISVFAKLILALRRILAFITGYWVFASIFSVPFPDMVFFTLQIVYFVVISVYTIGTVDVKHLMLDTRKIQKFKWVEKITYVVLATALFIRKYFSLISEHQISNADSISNVFAGFTHLVKENYAHALQVERQVEASLVDMAPEREFFNGANLSAFTFLAILVMVGSI